MKTYNPPKTVEIVREIQRFERAGEVSQSITEWEITTVDLLKYDDSGIVYVLDGRKCFMPYSSLHSIQERKEVK